MDALTRSKIAGGLLSILLLTACVPHCEELLGADSFFVQGNYLRIAVVPILFILVYYADFLFARAFAVACIYAAYVLLREGYAFDDFPLYPLLAVIFFLTGILGIVIGAKPVWMRDWLRKTVVSARARFFSAGAFALAGVIALAGLILKCFR